MVFSKWLIGNTVPLRFCLCVPSRIVASSAPVRCVCPPSVGGRAIHDSLLTLFDCPLPQHLGVMSCCVPISISLLSGPFLGETSVAIILGPLEHDPPVPGHQAVHEGELSEFPLDRFPNSTTPSSIHCHCAFVLAS
jgi:hypothetical protein